MKELTKLEVVLGGIAVPARLATGETREVTVRAFKLREYTQAARIVDNEFALVALACEQPLDWIETLSPDGYEALAAEMRRQNACFFAWHDRRASEVMRGLPPGMAEKVMDQMARAATDQASPGSSGKSRPRPA